MRTCVRMYARMRVSLWIGYIIVNLRVSPVCMYLITTDHHCGIALHDAVLCAVSGVLACALSILLSLELLLPNQPFRPLLRRISGVFSGALSVLPRRPEKSLD